MFLIFLMQKKKNKTKKILKKGKEASLILGIKTTQLTKVLNIPYYRGVTVLDHLPAAIQRATTKVKFKQGIHKFL